MGFEKKRYSMIIENDPNNQSWIRGGYTNMKSVKDLPGYPFQDPYGWPFDCRDKQLKSLEGCPQVINGDFCCSFNLLQSLQYCPQIVKGGFLCSYNNLQSLQYCPQIVNGSFYCNNNNLQSLQNIHKYCKQIDRTMCAPDNPIKSHVLGVMLIENIQGVTFRQKQSQAIINRHLKTDRDVYLCQDSLIKAGFAEYAQL
jgi:hypothetical protein